MNAISFLVAWQGRRGVLLAVAPLLAFGLNACTGAARLEIDAITPGRLSAGSGAQLLVSGAGFEDGDLVWLGATPLQPTIWVNSRVLSATVPGGVPPATYDVAVQTASGQRVVRAAAIIVGSPGQESETSLPRGTVQPIPRERATLPPRATPPLTTTRPATAAIATTTRAVPPGLQVAGHWKLVDTVEMPSPAMQPLEFTFRDLVLRQSGNRVSGSSDDGIVSLQGTLSDRTLTADYLAQNGTSGQFVWTFAGDGTSFSGTFTSTAPNRGNSLGSLIRAGP